MYRLHRLVTQVRWAYGSCQGVGMELLPFEIQGVVCNMFDLVAPPGGSRSPLTPWTAEHLKEELPAKTKETFAQRLSTIASGVGGIGLGQRIDEVKSMFNRLSGMPLPRAEQAVSRPKDAVNLDNTAHAPTHTTSRMCDAHHAKARTSHVS